MPENHAFGEPIDRLHWELFEFLKLSPVVEADPFGDVIVWLFDSILFAFVETFYLSPTIISFQCFLSKFIV